MIMTTLTSREFDCDRGAAREAARNEPVFITNDGRPTHVLLTMEDYERLTGRTSASAGDTMSLAEAVAQDEGADLEFKPPHFGSLSKPADFD
jgi:PHD/YefM family antitoxin component YafN of YafNO toxin-antitoxin module